MALEFMAARSDAASRSAVSTSSALSRVEMFESMLARRDAAHDRAADAFDQLDSAIGRSVDADLQRLNQTFLNEHNAFVVEQDAIDSALEGICETVRVQAGSASASSTSLQQSLQGQGRGRGQGRQARGSRPASDSQPDGRTTASKKRPASQIS